MKVEDINAVQQPTSLQGLKAILMTRYANGSNSFWLSHGEEEFPTLSILVKDGLAVLHYVPKEFDAGIRSVGKMPGLNPTGTTSFSISQNPADDVQELNDAIVPFPVALAAAEEFFFANDPPNSIEWLEL